MSNPGPAGWAWYIDDEHWASGGWPHGTNNMGELMAVLDLLRATAVDADQPLRILCDSQYVINSVTRWMPGWKRKGWVKRDGKPVMNVELMQAIDEAIQGRDIRFEWVKGHAGHRLNEAADTRAHGAALAFQRGEEPDSGPGYGKGDVTGAPVSGSHSAERAGFSQCAPSADSPTGAEAPVPLFDTDLEEVWAAERSLLTDAVRADPAQLRALLHPDFVEHGSSGRIFTRSRLLADVAPLGATTTLEVLGSSRLGPDSVLLRWRTVSGAQTSLRSSVWVRDDSLGRSRWRLLFTQGTRQSGAIPVA